MFLNFFDLWSLVFSISRIEYWTKKEETEEKIRRGKAQAVSICRYRKENICRMNNSTRNGCNESNVVDCRQFNCQSLTTLITIDSRFWNLREYRIRRLAIVEYDTRLSTKENNNNFVCSLDRTRTLMDANHAASPLFLSSRITCNYFHDKRA